MSRRAPKQAEGSMTPQAVKARVAAKDSGAAAPRAKAGNAAIASMMEDASAKQIPASMRARMERSFGMDLRGVRVDDSPAAREDADSLNAEALVRDGQIRWSSTAPRVDSPEAEPLLAHEIAHVVQQDRAGDIQDRVSAPGDAAEAAADTAASQALAGRSAAGQTASASTGGAVAGVARQPKAPGGTSATAISDASTATQLLTNFLQKVAKTSPPQNIKKARVVRDALRKLAASAGASANLLDVDAFVDADTTSGDPASMARQFVAKVPRISAAALNELDKQPFIDAQPGLVDRASNLVDKSAAGGGDIPTPPGYVSPEDKGKNIGDTLAAMRGGTVPGGFGPVKVDIFQLGRIAKGAGGVLKPTQTKPAPVQSEDYPSVTAAIAKMPKDALVPAEAKGKGDPGEWADTAEFALAVAREMDKAQKSKQTECTITLGANYETVKGREALRDAVEAIIQQLRDALPHHAAGVKYVIVKTGRTTLTRGMVQTP